MISIQLTYIEKGSINERFFYQLTKLKTFYSYPANQFRKSGIHTEDPLFVKKNWVSYECPEHFCWNFGQRGIKFQTNHFQIIQGKLKDFLKLRNC